MTKPVPLSQLVSDDLLLDRAGSRTALGDDPVAGLLAALAAHADQPLTPVATGRRFGRRRVLTVLTALVVGASGAGVAAAIGPPQPERAVAPAHLGRGTPGTSLGGQQRAQRVDPGGQVVRDPQGRSFLVGPDGSSILLPLGSLARLISFGLPFSGSTPWGANLRSQVPVTSFAPLVDLRPAPRVRQPRSETTPGGADRAPSKPRNPAQVSPTDGSDEGHGGMTPRAEVKADATRGSSKPNTLATAGHPATTPASRGRHESPPATPHPAPPAERDSGPHPRAPKGSDRSDPGRPSDDGHVPSSAPASKPAQPPAPTPVPPAPTPAPTPAPSGAVPVAGPTTIDGETSDAGPRVHSTGPSSATPTGPTSAPSSAASSAASSTSTTAPQPVTAAPAEPGGDAQPDAVAEALTGG